MFKRYVFVLLAATSVIALSPILASSKTSSRIGNCSPKQIDLAVLHMREAKATINAIVNSRTKSLNNTNGKYANPSSGQIALLRTLADDFAANKDKAAASCFLELATILEADLKKDAVHASLTGSK